MDRRDEITGNLIYTYRIYAALFMGEKSNIQKASHTEAKSYRTSTNERSNNGVVLRKIVQEQNKALMGEGRRRLMGGIHLMGDEWRD